jgi:hypothetical protein
MKSWIHFLGGSVTVYLLMAACSAGSKHGSSRDEAPGPTASQGGMPAAGGAEVVATAGTSTPNGTSGDTAAPGGGVSGGIGGMLGDMMDPVDDADAAPATSGTRLRARYYVGEDGSKQFVGWRDSTRKEDCAIQKAEDGKLRCLPTAGGYGTFFSDASCSTAIAYVSIATTCAQPSVPTYIADLAAVTCSASWKLFKVGAEVSPAALYLKSGETCTSTPVTASYRYYATAHVAPSDFVAATEQVD